MVQVVVHCSFFCLFCKGCRPSRFPSPSAAAVLQSRASGALSASQRDTSRATSAHQPCLAAWDPGLRGKTNVFPARITHLVLVKPPPLPGPSAGCAGDEVGGVLGGGGWDPEPAAVPVRADGQCWPRAEGSAAAVSVRRVWGEGATCVSDWSVTAQTVPLNLLFLQKLTKSFEIFTVQELVVVSVSLVFLLAYFLVSTLNFWWIPRLNVSASIFFNSHNSVKINLTFYFLSLRKVTSQSSSHPQKRGETWKRGSSKLTPSSARLRLKKVSGIL